MRTRRDVQVAYRPSIGSRSLSLPFSSLGKKFIAAQIARGNSPVTVQHYEQSIRKLACFFAYQLMGEDAYQAAARKDRIQQGEGVSVSILDTDGLDMDLRLFLIDVEEVSVQTVSTYFRDYRAIAYFAMDQGLIKQRSIPVQHVETDVREVYSAEELDKLLREPKKNCTFTEYRDWVLIHYLLATGNRIGTIVNLKIADVDFEDCMITINVQKNKKKTRIPLEETRLVPILKTYIRRWLTDREGRPVCEYLFPSTYTDSDFPMSRISMGRSIAQYNLSRGVEKTSVHLFRHTFAKNWIVNGGDLHSLQKMLGHSTLDMVTHYANLYDTDLQAKVQSYAALATHKRRGRGGILRQKTRE